jgi:DNA-binding MarR family transcriptional regulator
MGSKWGKPLAIDSKVKTAEKLLENFSKFRKIGWKQNAFPQLNPGEMMMLWTISRMSNEMNVVLKTSDISTALNVAPPTVTQQLNGLESRGYVERRIDHGDRRVMRVRLTEQGLVVLENAHDELLSAMTGLVEHLGEEDSNKFVELLERVHTYFQDTGPTAPNSPR